MKCETTDTVLKFVLAVLVILAVIFALQTMFRTRELRSLNLEATMANNYVQQIRSLYNDSLIYSQRNPDPDLTRILQTVQTKPATR
ncbi:MAG: hypothetical protein ABR955_09125 [Verrucomicrobiota bacterium]|jgi:hypothetical protein